MTSHSTLLDQDYWNNCYTTQQTHWDLGIPSPPIKAYIDQLKNKKARILIPGCGHAHEATYLLEQGFTNITIIDIAPSLIKTIKKKWNHNPNIQILWGDFFKLHGTYDFIIEQTFFCALPPNRRLQYVCKMHELLAHDGILFGVLFNRTFQHAPPFGGSKTEYVALFKEAFITLQMHRCTNSAVPRANTELFIELKKRT